MKYFIKEGMVLMQKGGWVSPAESLYIDILLNVSILILHGSVVFSQCPDIDLRILLSLSSQLPTES